MTAVGQPPSAPDAVVPVAAARWVTVAGVAPDVGTTTVAALLTIAYAAHRRYRIIAVDSHPVGGDLAGRLATPNAGGVAEIAEAAPQLDTFEALEAYLDRSPDGAWTATGAAEQPPDPEQCAAALMAVSGFFALGIVDSGPIGEPVANSLLATAQAPLLVAPATQEGVLRAACFVDWLSAKQDAMAGWHCGVALVSSTRRRDADVGRAARLLTDRGARVVPIPFDQSLVAGRITAGSISDGTLTAVQRLSGEMLSRAARSHNTRRRNRRG